MERLAGLVNMQVFHEETHGPLQDEDTPRPGRPAGFQPRSANSSLNPRPHPRTLERTDHSRTASTQYASDRFREDSAETSRDLMDSITTMPPNSQIIARLKIRRHASSVPTCRSPVDVIGRSARRMRWVSRPCSFLPRTTTSGRHRRLTDEHTCAFRAALDETGIVQPVAHTSYLINMASPDEVLWKKSIAAMIEEVERCHRLGIGDLVVHPGAHMGAGEEAGLERAAAALDEILARTAGLGVMIDLETTAGQGSSLGYRLRTLAGDPEPRARRGRAGRVRGYLPRFRGGVFSRPGGTVR